MCYLAFTQKAEAMTLTCGSLCDFESESYCFSRKKFEVQWEEGEEERK